MGKSRATPEPHLPSGPAAAQPLHYPLLFGLLGGLLLLAFFIYPAGAFPLQAMLLTGIMGLAAVGLAARMLRVGGASRAAFLSALGGAPALAGMMFILWAVLRWRMAEVPALERDWIVSLLALGLALLLGCGVGALNRAEPAPGSSFTILARLIVLGALGFGIYSLYQYFIGYPQSLKALDTQLQGAINSYTSEGLRDALEKRRVAGQLGNPNLFAAQLVLFSIAGLAAFLRDPSRLWRRLALAGIAAALLALVMTASRGGLLTLFAAAGCAAPFLRRGRGAVHSPNPPLAGFLIAFLSLAYASRAWAAPITLLQRLGQIDTIRERFYYWQIALKVWARHPWIGEGPGGFSLLYLTLKPPLARESQYAHSWLFQFGAELGLVGLVLFVLFWGGAAVAVWRARRRGGRHPEAPWCLGALLVLVFNGLFEFSLQWQPFLVACGLFAGLTLGLTARPAPLSPIRKKRGILGLVLAGVIAGGAAFLSPPHYLAEQHRMNGNTLAEDGNWAAAVAEYARAVRWQPRDHSALMSLALAVDRAGSSPSPGPHLSPEQMMEQAARLNPRSASIRDAQALWLADRGRLDEAIGKMGEAIACYPSNVAYLLDRARLWLRAGRPGPARADLLTIENERLPVWKFQQEPYDELRAAAGLPRLYATPSEGRQTHKLQ